MTKAKFSARLQFYLREIYLKLTKKYVYLFLFLQKLNFIPIF